MKKLILAALLTICASSAFAHDGCVTVKTGGVYVVGSPKR